MIVIWPLIVSKTVDQKILPGVCKALEKYVYINELDEVLESANRSIKAKNSKSKIFIALKTISGKMKLVAEQLEEGRTIEDFLLETYGSVEDQSLESLLELTGRGKKGQTQQSTTSSTKRRDPLSGIEYTSTSSTSSQPKDRDSYADAYQAAKAKSDIIKVTGEAPTFGRMDQTLISQEPTWNSVTDQQGNTTAIGVKCVPFIIDNEQSLIRLMTVDRYRRDLSASTHVQARKILRLIQNIGNRAWKATLGLLSFTGFVDKDLVKGTITKNWKNDIILQNTSFGKKMFILLNKMDLDDEFVKEAKGVKKLFTLGWTSFIIADDVNKVVTFCMKAYKGMCSMVNYGFLYADSRTQHQVYQDIDDIRRSATPMFRMKRRKKSMITDNLAQYKLDQYSQQLLESDLILNESAFPEVVNFIKNKPKQVAGILKSIASSTKRNDFKGAAKIARRLNPNNKKLDINKSVQKLMTTNPDFKKNFNLTKRIFKNSLPGLDEESLKVGSTLLAIGSIINKDDKNIKNNIKQVVLKTRNKIKSLDEDNDDFSADLRVAFYFSLATLIVGGATTVGVIFGLSVMIPASIPAITTLYYYTIYSIVVFFIFKVLSLKYYGG